MPFTITNTPSVVFEKCIEDIVGPISPSEEGNRYILTVQDDLSAFLIAVPLKGQTAEEVPRAFVENVVLVYGQPQVVLSDCGASFLSKTFKNMCKLLGIKKIQSTSFRPQTQGSLERTHRKLMEYIMSYVAMDLTNWDPWVR
jgi:transposase InsO family protein